MYCIVKKVTSMVEKKCTTAGNPKRGKSLVTSEPKVYFRIQYCVRVPYYCGTCTVLSYNVHLCVYFTTEQARI